MDDPPLKVGSDAGLGGGAQIRSNGIDFLLKTWMCTSLLLRLMMHLIQSRNHTRFGQIDPWYKIQKNILNVHLLSFTASYAGPGH